MEKEEKKEETPNNVAFSTTIDDKLYTFTFTAPARFGDVYNALSSIMNDFLVRESNNLKRNQEAINKKPDEKKEEAPESK